MGEKDGREWVQAFPVVEVLSRLGNSLIARRPLDFIGKWRFRLQFHLVLQTSRWHNTLSGLSMMAGEQIDSFRSWTQVGEGGT